jgi:phytoene dehydrogenase-like protein
MSTRDERRVVIVGGGPNGLVAAILLARAGLRPLLLERRAALGGASVTGELHPGFRCSTFAHAAGPLLPEVRTDLALERHGLAWLKPAVRILALAPDGGALAIGEDRAETARDLARHAAQDGPRYRELVETFEGFGRLLRPLLAAPPPDIDAPTRADLWGLLRGLRDYRRLGRRDGYRLLRFGPMAAADLVAEWFEGPLARALFAARGIHGCNAGPWSAGTGSGLLLQAGYDGAATLPAAFPRGGMGALTAALAAAASEAGAELRTGAAVVEIRVEGQRADRVVLADGTGIDARAVLSGLDPQSTFLQLIDPMHLDPSFVQRIRNYRSQGVVAKVNLALAGLPTFRGVDPKLLSGRIHVGPTIDDLERAFDAAKYGEISERPYLDVVIPSVLDPSLAPAGAHVLSALVQYAPYRLREGDWTTLAPKVGDLVIRTLAHYAPDLPGLVLGRQVFTPVQLEADLGITGGHPYHGEHALDQLFVTRPLLGWSRYRTPIDGLYLCGAGTHPGGGVTGAPGWNAARAALAEIKASR